MVAGQRLSPLVTEEEEGDCNHRITGIPCDPCVAVHFSVCVSLSFHVIYFASDSLTNNRNDHTELLVMEGRFNGSQVIHDSHVHTLFSSRPSLKKLTRDLNWYSLRKEEK